MKYIFKYIDELIITTTNTTLPSIIKSSNITTDNTTYEGNKSSYTVIQHNLANVEGNGNLDKEM